MMQELKHVMCVADNNYAQHLGVMMTSLLMRTRCPEHFSFWILDGGISGNNRSKLVEVSKRWGCSIEFIAVDTEVFQNFPISDHISHAAYYRIIGPDRLADLSKVLYIDCDIVVLGDITPLWDLDMNGMAVLAVEDANKFDRHESLQMPQESRYFNSGVMLIDCAKWRACNIAGKAIGFLSSHPDRIVFWDQDALNFALSANWMAIPHKWNFQTQLLNRGVDHNGCIVMHYSSPSKPWQYSDRHPFKREYYFALECGPWKGWMPPEMTCWKVIKRIIRNLITLRISPAQFSYKG